MTRRLAHFDPIGGASGDMILGALIDSGLSQARLGAALRGLSTPAPFSLRISRAVRGGIEATKVDVAVRAASPPRLGPDDLVSHLRRSRLAPGPKATALRILGRLLAAERRVHGRAGGHRLDLIGRVDTLVDVAGAAVGMELLSLGSVTVGSFPLSTEGIARDRSHPAPAPAAAVLLEGFPVRTGPGPGEWVTPTGAAVLTTVGRPASGVPAMRLERVGCGAGGRDADGTSNVLRLFLGASLGATDLHAGSSSVLECELDDMSPENLAPLSDALISAGALDVSVTSVAMKKGRPGWRVTVVGPSGAGPHLARVLLRHSTSLGVRLREESRFTLPRQIGRVQTPFGPIRVKSAVRPGGRETAKPEADDVRQAARLRGVTAAEVSAAALDAWRRGRARTRRIG